MGHFIYLRLRLGEETRLRLGEDRRFLFVGDFGLYFLVLSLTFLPGDLCSLRGFGFIFLELFPSFA